MKNKLSIILLSLVIIFVGIVSFYKIYIMKNRDNNKNDILYGIYDIDTEGLYIYDINYKEEYKNNILTDIVKEVEYSMFYEDEALYGRVFIGLNNKLYLSDDLHKKNYLLLDEKIESLYDASAGLNICSVFVITKSGELYHVGLTHPTISNRFIKKINIEEKVTNFTNLSVNTYLDVPFASVVVYTDKGNMYDAKTLTSYNPNTVNVMSEYIVYETRCISNEEREFLVNSEGEPYKVNTIVVANEPISELEGNPTIIIVTEDNKLIYTYNNKTYEYKKEVKIIGVSEDGNIVISFDDDKYMEFEGFYDLKHFPVLQEESENISE